MKALDGLGLAVVAALTATGVVLMSPGHVAARSLDVRYTIDPFTRTTYDSFGEPGFQALATALETFFGPHAQPKLPQESYAALGLTPERIDVGRRNYEQKCMHCHGMSGGGDGPTAPFLLPRPRNFRAGVIKFTSTERSSPPVHDDILRVLQRGVAYTAMPSFVNESHEELESLASYVQFLMMRGETERLTAFTLDDEGTFEEKLSPEELQKSILEYMTESFDSVQSKWTGAKDTAILPPVPRTAANEESLARGKELFLSAKTECSACHAPDGHGKGPNVYGEIKDEQGNVTGVGFKLKDDWGNEARPADLTRGFYRGGDRPIDLYRRVHEGIKGTPMPAFGASLTPEQIWDLVNYVYSIRFQGVAGGAR